MKIRMIAFVLLLAMLPGVFGCTGGTLPDEGGTDITSAEETESVTEAPKPEPIPKTENLLNFALTDADGGAQFQIVYSVKASTVLKEGCEKLAADIAAVTGVDVPVVHSNEKQKTHEILVGDVVRSDTIDVMDQYDLDEDQFVIRVIGTRVTVYAPSEQATIIGLSILMELMSYKNETLAEYGVEDDMDYLYVPNAQPPVSILSANENHVEFSLQNSETVFTYARISFAGNGGWRVQTKFSEEHAYDDFGAAQKLAYSMGETDPSVLETITVVEDGNLYTITAPDGSRAVINTEGFQIDFYTPSDRLAATVTNISSYIGGSSIAGRLEENEAIFGTGERFDSVNQRGKYIEMYSKDVWSSPGACYMVIPLLCSSRGSGVFINSYEYMTLDLGKKQKDTWKASVSGVPLDAYIYTTEQIPDVINAYSVLTGYAKMPEEWTYGMIVCAYAPSLSQKWSASISGNGEGVYEMIANMEKYDLPWTGVLVEAWGAYSVAKHDDLKELCDYVHSLGKKLMVYMPMGNTGGNMVPDRAFLSGSEFAFDASYYLYRKMTEAEMQEMEELRREEAEQETDGGESDSEKEPIGVSRVPDFAKRLSRAYLDVTNPEAVTWFFEQYWYYLANDIGVDGCKIDFCEQVPEDQEILYYDRSMSVSGSHHWYPTVFCSMFGEMISSKPNGGMSYTRGGGIGSQRAPYMWAGDQTREYGSLAMQLKAVLTSGLSGVPFMSYDMSGYQYGGSKSIAKEAQVFIRGTQFTAFTICMQTHGTVRRSYQFAEENENYSYVTAIYRAYTKLHEHLAPYITELSEQACTTGMPIVRHLVLHWQDDQNVYGMDDEYMLGDAFLVAPILNATYERDIYLPEGEWIDLNTGEEYSVGAEGLWLEGYGATIAELPTFYNKNTESEIASTLVDGIMELYDYARSVAP